MNKYIRIILLFLLLNIACHSAFALERIFYALRYQLPDRTATSKQTITSIKANYKKIDILIPQAYIINEAGEIEKDVEPEILAFAQSKSMKIMPLVTNKKFDPVIAHHFLTNPDAQLKAIDTLISLCKKYHFYGLEIDFEMIKVDDRDNLTKFFELAATKLHHENLHISFSVAPVVTNNPTTLFLKKTYANWAGAYDFAAIGKFADFISMMAYNQHGEGIIAGPTASLPWVKQTIKYALQYVPASKISLGIPGYSTYWYTGEKNIKGEDKISVRMYAITYNDAKTRLRENHLKAIWDPLSKTSYAIIPKDWLNEYVFIEDAKSFTKKLSLAKKYNLYGISVFDLGTEDPKIWDKL